MNVDLVQLDREAPWAGTKRRVTQPDRAVGIEPLLGAKL